MNNSSDGSAESRRDKEKTDPKRNSESQASSVGDTIPDADIKQAGSTTRKFFVSSRMWILTLFCLALAVGLVWWSLPDRGLTISIRFPEGHGLQSEDIVRFRGIDVGVVWRVELTPDLSAVDVIVNLKKSAEPLARKGTRFWIVRPSLSFSGISGLETAVGHKYIGLVPGAQGGPRQYRFEGLANPMPEVLGNEGLEIIIRGDKRNSVNIGSPLSCRGVEVGRVISVGLSQDARYVDIRAKVLEKFRKLITTQTRFWATSGVDVDFSLGGGFKLKTESLETLARGGISLLVTENGGEKVFPGHVFDLYSTPNLKWFESSRSVRLSGTTLFGAVPMSVRWTHDGLFGNSEKETTFVGIPFRDSKGQEHVLVPSDVLQLPAKGLEGSLHIFGPSTREPGLDSPSPDSESSTGSVVSVDVPPGFAQRWVDTQHDVRLADSVESCLAVRANSDGGVLTFLDYPIDSRLLSYDETDPDRWLMNGFDGDRRIWNGAPVLSMDDGKIIGFLLVDDDQASIVKITETFMQSIR